MKHLPKPGRRARVATALLLSSVLVSAWAWEPGRMTGGGSIICPAPVYRVTFGYELHCQRENTDVSVPNNLEINFSNGDNFHLTQLTTSVCSGPTASTPTAPFNTLTGDGTGTFNGQAAVITFTLVDNAEPGAGADTASFLIKTNSGTVLDCSRVLEGGNNQAHRATGSKP